MIDQAEPIVTHDANAASEHATPVNPTAVERAQQALRRSGYSQLAEVSCEFHEGVMILRGQVPTYYLKQLAQTLVRAVHSVEYVDNRLEVRNE